ncbi:MAG: hypothetical protein AAB351_03310 [Patescibacteria group bacterium]
MGYVFAILVIILGVLMMKYTVQITNFTGKLDFAEKYLGAGTAAGTYTWWRLCGLAFICLAVAWLFGFI